MAGSLGDAYIKVHSDTSKVAPEMEAGVKKAADEVEKGNDFDGLVKGADKAGTRAGKAGGESFGESFIKDANGRLRTADGRFAAEADKLGKSVGEKIGEKVGDSTGDSLKKKISGFGSLLAPDWIKTIGVWVGVIGPAALELADALLPAVGGLAAGLIPVVLGGAAALGVFKLAVAGVGKALKDINGPTKTFNADLKALTPNQREFVKQVKAVQPELKKFKSLIGNAFFADFADQIKPLAKTLIPGLSASLAGIAGNLGYAAEKLALFLERPQTVAMLAKIFTIMGEAIGEIADTLPLVLSALLKIGASAAPYVLKAAEYAERLAKGFSDFISKAQNSGGLTRFLNTAQVALGAIFAIGKDAFKIVAALLNAAGSTGGGGALIGTLNTIAGVFDKLGKNGGLAAVFKIYNQVFSELASIIAPLLDPLGKLLIALGSSLSKDLKDLTPALVNIVNNGLTPLLNVITDLLPVINPVVDAVAKLLSWLTKDPTTVKIATAALIAYFAAVKTKGLADTIMAVAKGTKSLAAAMGLVDAAADANIVGLFFIAIAAQVGAIVYLWTHWNDLASKLGGWGPLIRDVGTELKVYVVSALLLLGIHLSDLTGLWTNFINGAQRAADAIPMSLDIMKHAAETFVNDVEVGFGNLIGYILLGFMRLPAGFETAMRAIIGIALKLPPTLDGIVRNAVDRMIHVFATVVPRVDGAVARLPMLMDGIMKKMWENAFSQTKKGVVNVDSQIKGLIEKILFLTPQFEGAGKSLIRALFDGLGNAGGFSLKLGKSISAVIIRDLNSAIRKINQGINSVGNKIPGVHLPNIPLLAKGAYVTSPTLAVFGERGPEVVLPVNDPGRSAQLLQQSGLSAALNMGAPNVNVQVNIGQQAIDDIVDTRISYSNAQQANEITYGTRAMA